MELGKEVQGRRRRSQGGTESRKRESVEVKQGKKHESLQRERRKSIRALVKMTENGKSGRQKEEEGEGRGTTSRATCPPAQRERGEGLKKDGIGRRDESGIFTIYTGYCSMNGRIHYRQ